MFQSVKILVAFVALLATVGLHGEETYKFKMVVEIECPDSEELQALIDAHPKESEEVITDYDQWKAPFLETISKLGQLVESRKIYNSSWSVNYDKIQK